MEIAIIILRAGIAATMIVYGINQLIDPKAWFEYLPEWLKKLSPIPEIVEMRLHGFGNLALGLLLLIGFPGKCIEWVALVWWLSIFPFTFKVSWRSSMRDFSIICALISLVLLVS